LPKTQMHHPVDEKHHLKMRSPKHRQVNHPSFARQHPGCVLASPATTFVVATPATTSVFSFCSTLEDDSHRSGAC
jgi:hypothetical protein